ncbi:hypothetical protein AAF134_01005 [Synechococcus lacustris Tous-12m]
MTPSASSSEKTSSSSCSEKAEYLIFLKAQIKSLELEATAITAELTAIADSGDLELYSYETGIYDFEKVRMALVSRNVWSYSPAVKELQEQEKENGTATSKVSSYYKFSLI